MARSRKPSDKTAAEESQIENDKIEDAVIIEETGVPGEDAAGLATTGKDDPDRPGDEGASVVDATEHSEVQADADQAAARKLEEDQPSGGLTEGDETIGALSVDAQRHEDDTQEEARPAAATGSPENEVLPEDETTEETRPERDERPPAQPATHSGGSGLGAGGIAALIFGGIVAAFIGVLASRFIFPEGWPGQGGDTDVALAEIQTETGELRNQIESQSAQIADLRGSIEALGSELTGLAEADPGVAALREEIGEEVAAIRSAVSSTTDRMDELASMVEGLAGRVDQIELRPAPEGLDTASLDAEIADFRAELSAAVEEARREIVEAQQQAAAITEQAAEEAAQRGAEAAEAAAAREAEAAAEAERLRAEAESAAEAAARRSVVARIVAAVENGEPFAEDLAAFDGDLPGVLAESAETGVPTLRELQEAFPSVAREALDASIRADAGDSAMDRAMAFLRVQTGARSLEPRPGDDPDAILSRAEAALRQGDLEAALSELAALPESGAEQMSGWIEEARARLEAEQAAAALAQSLNGN